MSNEQRGTGLPDDAVWVDDEFDVDAATAEETYVDDNPIGLTGDLKQPAAMADAREVFAHETAAESAEVFAEKGETAGEAAAAFERSLLDRVVDTVTPVVATVAGMALPAMAKGAQALAPVVDRAEQLAQPLIDQAGKLLAPAMEKAEPYIERVEPLIEKAQVQLGELADQVAGRADQAAELLDTAAERVRDTTVGLVEMAKPMAETVFTKVKDAVKRK